LGIGLVVEGVGEVGRGVVVVEGESGRWRNFTLSDGWVDSEVEEGREQLPAGEEWVSTAFWMAQTRPR